jgi:hypothetical protein
MVGILGGGGARCQDRTGITALLYFVMVGGHIIRGGMVGIWCDHIVAFFRSADLDPVAVGQLGVWQNRSGVFRVI